MAVIFERVTRFELAKICSQACVLSIAVLVIIQSELNALELMNWLIGVQDVFYNILRALNISKD